MLLSDLSVKRPVLATVVNLLIIIFGIVAFTLLPLREYPDIDPPIVSINTKYTGASADIVETKITQILEDRISGISGVKNITSSSEEGRSRIKIEFDLSRNIDAAANDIRERVSRALDNMPEQADPPEVFKSDDDDNVIAWFNLRSENMSVIELTDYAKRYIIDRFAVVEGVARMRIGGGREYVMRVSLNRIAMAAKGITVNDIESALRRENVELPAGKIESIERDFSIRVTRAYSSIEDYQSLIIGRGDDGHLISLKEIADVSLNAADDETLFRGNNVNMVGLGIIKQSKANTIDVIKSARDELAEIQQNLPQGTFIVDSYDSSVFIQGSIDEVYNTLQIAVLLVILIIYLFLGNVRATLIPAVTVPVALIGSMIVLNWLGFSINLLTLLALVLAIGLVVDDAIVVLENIYRRIENGEAPMLAAFNGAKEVGFAVIATTLVLVAVFVPLVFLQGNVGRLFTEFALAIAAAVVFSSFTALTLSPMMCSLLLKNKEKNSDSAENSIKQTAANPASIQPSLQKRFSNSFNQAFNKLEQSYANVLNRSVHTPLLLIILFVVAGFTIHALFNKLPAEYAPKEDRGGFFIRMNGAEGASFESNSRNIAKIEKILIESLDKGEIDRLLVRVPGFGGTGGFAIIGMPQWDERPVDTYTLMKDLRPKLNDLIDVKAYPIMRRGIGGRGVGRPVQFVLQGNTYEELAQWRDIIFDKAEENKSLMQLNSDYKETYPQFTVNINRERAADLGVSVGDIGKTLQTMLGQRKVTTYIDRGEEYDVLLKGDEQYHQSPNDIDNIYVRSNHSGQLIPLANLITISERATSRKLNRYNRLRSITITANISEDYTLGEALDYLAQLAKDELPAHASVDYKGLSQLIKESGNSMLFVFILALLITYLVLAAQFENFIHPFVILLTVPLALVGALAGLYLADMSLNIFSQIGLVMLIGLAAKNGILIVEFANQRRDQGIAFKQALVGAAKHRLRPIIMTSFTTVMSAIPLILASGPGSESRMVIGMVIFAGVSLASFMTLFIVPSAYYWLCKNTGSPQQRSQELTLLAQINNEEKR